MKGAASATARFVAAIAATVLAACGGAQGSVQAAEAGQGAVAAWTGRAAPAFSVESLDSKGSLASPVLAGKVVLLDLWASWCEPCGESLPVHAALARQWRAEGLEVVLVSLDEDRAAAQRAGARIVPGVALWWDVGQRLARDLQPDKMPTAFVIGRDGRVRAVVGGWGEEQRQRVERAVMDALQVGRAP